MSNHLRMAMIARITTLHALGWSHRRIARELGIHREMVARHLALAAKPATNLTPGSEALAGPEVAGNRSMDALVGPEASPDSTMGSAGMNPGPEELLAPVASAAEPSEARSPAVRLGPSSLCESYRLIIQEKLQRGLSAQRIYQDLVGEVGFAHSYQSVKRFVRRLGLSSIVPFRRMECEPGAEVQVDFGTGPWIAGPEGKPRRTHVFRMVLSHSRKGYSEAVRRQTTEDFLGCLENAF